MSLTLAFLVETFAIHLPDMVLAGGGSYLAARGAKGRRIGFVLIILYVVAVLGMAMTPDFEVAGPILGLFSAGLLGWLGSKQKRKAAPDPV